MARGVYDSETVEEFRLYITARLYQGFTQSSVEDELIGWGMRSETAIELVSSTRIEGTRPVEFTDIYLEGLHVGRELDPMNKAKIRASDRAARHARTARRMIEKELGDVPVDLGYEPSVSPYLSGIAERRAEKNFTLIAVVVACIIAAVIAGFLLL